MSSTFTSPVPLTQAPAQDIRPGISSLNYHEDPAIVTIASGLQTHQEYSDAIAASLNDLITNFQALVANQNGIAPSSTSYIEVSPGATFTPDLSAAVYQQIDLTANLAISPPTGLAPAELVLILVQDATGGRTVTFNAAYLGASNFDVDQTPSTYSVYKFVIRPDGTPVLTDRPITGLTWV